MSSIQITQLQEAATTARTRARMAEENNARRAEMISKLSSLQRKRKHAAGMLEFFRTCETVSKGYLAEKQRVSIDAINEAIAAATAMVEDAQDVMLLISGNNKAALVVRESRQLVNLCEGSAHRALLSVLPRKAILENTGHMQFLLLDEPFATLSDATSEEVSSILRAWGETMQIILIEQKPSVFAMGADCTYQFSKTEGCTRATRVEDPI